MINPTAIIQQFLIQNGLAFPPVDGNTPWPCYIASLPDGPGVPDNAICLYDTAGVKQGRAMKTGKVWVNYGMQIKVRGIDYPTGWMKMDDIVQLMDQVGPSAITINNLTFSLQTAKRVSAPISLGTETGTDKRRSLFSLNLLLTIN